MGHFKQALALLPELPGTAERQRKELLLQSALGVPLVMTQGYGAPEVECTYARARTLCQHGGAPRRRFTALRGLCVFHLVRAEYQIALKLGAQLLRIATEEQDPALLMEAHMSFGAALFFGSEMPQAHAHLGEALALYDPQRHRAHTFRYGQDPGIGCGGFDAWALLLLGYPDQARKTIARTLQLAKQTMIIAARAPGSSAPNPAAVANFYHDFHSAAGPPYGNPHEYQCARRSIGAQKA
jgi:predicted ATPase